MKLGVIGFGNMGSSIINGLISQKVLRRDNIFVYDIDRSKLKNVKVKVKKNNEELVKDSDVIIIAVKPKDAFFLFEEIKEYLTEKKVLISIMAGIGIKRIEESIGKDIPIIRIMPNLNVKVNSGVIVYCSNKKGKKYEKIVKKLFSPVGIVLKMPENKFDIITAISGSGPGFLFYICEKIEKICIEKGIPKNVAKKIVKYLLYGTGKMIYLTDKEPEELKNMVCSPGGTTLAGLKVFEEYNFYDILKKVIDEAENRSRQLSKN